VIEDLLSATVIVGILTSGIRLATPYLYAAMGEMLGQLSGVLNLGVDGMMLMGAFTAFFVAYNTGSLGLGLLAAVIVGAFMGLAMAFISVTMQAEQGISGIGIYLFGLGMSDLLFQKTIGTVETVRGFRPLDFGFLSDLPVVGEILFRHNAMVYGAYLLVPITWFLINKTTLGLKIRAVGQNPAAADSLGVSVAVVRYVTLTVGGMLAGVAGASLSIALLNVFQVNLTNGLGFIAVALVYFGGWRPIGILFGSLLFSLVNALQVWVQVLNIPLQSEYAVMMPYVLTIVVLVFTARRARQPAALSKPFDRGG
jgi:simple sugar transport system permease protein